MCPAVEFNKLFITLFLHIVVTEYRYIHKLAFLCYTLYYAHFSANTQESCTIFIKEEH